MVEGKLVAICQYGGEFLPNPDESMSYTGGEAHAIGIGSDTLFDEFKAEIASLFNIDINNMSIKYFLPNNRHTLITICNDKEFKRMLDFNVSAATADVYILNKFGCRSNITELGISVVTAEAAAHGGKRKRVTSGSRVNIGKMHVAPYAINNINTDFVYSVAPLNLSVPMKIDNRVVASNFMLPEVSLAATTDGLGHQGLITMELVDTNDPLGPCIESMPTLDDDMLHNSIPLGDTITGVGQEFDNVKEFRDLLCKYAIAKGFAYKFVKNESSRVTVKCIEDGCPWRIHASEISRKQRVVIKNMNSVHTCKERQGRATRQWLTSVIKEKLHALPHCKPKEIVKELYEEYGVLVTYSQVWRGREVAKSEIYNTSKENYNDLPLFCSSILKSNPGSVALYSDSQHTMFRRFFVSFHASLYGFKHGCRPLLFLDRIPLKANNQFKLLAAASVDGDDAVFPVAFAVVEDETYDSWLWFLSELSKVVPSSHAITFISGRQKGLDLAIPQVFNDGFHSYCLHHLIEELKAEISREAWSPQVKDALIDDFTRAAQACSMQDFDACIASIKNVSPVLAQWVLSSHPENWSDAFFGGSRYGHFSSIIMDTFNTWIPTKHESSILKMASAIHSKLMEMMNTRHDTSKSWGKSILTPSMDLKLQKELGNARKLSVSPSSSTVFEVRGNKIYVVDISRGSCTCERWRLSGLPCMHAAAVCNYIGRSAYDFCTRYLTADYYRMAYAEPLHPIPADIKGAEFNGEFDLVFPINSRPTGKPRRKRINPNKMSSMLRLCSRCKIAGHNKATCEAIL